MHLWSHRVLCSERRSGVTFFTGHCFSVGFRMGDLHLFQCGVVPFGGPFDVWLRSASYDDT